MTTEKPKLIHFNCLACGLDIMVESIKFASNHWQSCQPLKKQRQHKNLKASYET